MPDNGEHAADRLIYSLYKATEDETLWPGIVQRLKTSQWGLAPPRRQVHEEKSGRENAGCRDTRMHFSDSVSQFAYDPDRAAVAHTEAPFGLDQIPFKLPPSNAGVDDIPAGTVRFSADAIAALIVPDIHERPELNLHWDTAALASQTVRGRTAALNESLLQHTFLALRIAHKFAELREHGETLASGLGGLAVGLIVIDEDKRATPINDEARAILARRDLALWGGRLTTADKRARTQLDKLLAELTGKDRGRPSGGGVTIRRMNGHALQIWGVPLRHEERVVFDPAGHPCGLLFVIDPDRAPATPNHLLMEAFGLTRAETALTLGLLHGETVDEYCERTGISRNTARTHMRAIFDKLGINKQTELIRLLSGFRLLNIGERG